MARRRFEKFDESLKAGQETEKGKQGTFSKVEVVKVRKLDASLGSVYSLQYSMDGRFLAAGFQNGSIQLLSSTTGELKKDLRKTRHGGYPIMSLKFHPKDHSILFAGTSEGLVYAINIETGDFQTICTETGNEINCIDFDSEGYNFATAGKDLAVRIYDLKTYQLEREYSGYDEKTPNEQVCLGNTSRAFALKYHPEFNHIFITGGWDNNIKIWDSRRNDGVVRIISGPHICGDAIDISKHHILTGSWCANHALQVWNYTDGDLNKNVTFPHKGNGAFLYCAQMCDNNVVLAGGSGTNSAKAIDVKTDTCLGEVEMKKPVQALDSTLGGRMFAVGGSDDCIILASLS
ncbi:suppressor of mec-8 and unc-52 protein homolog 1-like [Gigantopelta aegis]|uniref:suppressor of mec-8 and unc-52 protein homolog 1-like n=1 Tax=Gigantopelta aegis TaxID=1735272 RepID=UPI001B88DAD1|nr:suppressor of mec-8 and unc-52 protein homolog 1-like [Gigantopelta aegis]